MIPIYKDEIVAGLSDVIKAGKTIAYVSPVSKIAINDPLIKAGKLTEFLKASSGDSDLYAVKSILVTSTWNLNDDVFSPLEIWKARRTPVDKPDNIGHDETHMIGHMTDSWAINEDGSIIAENTPEADLPDVFHILTSSVIYLRWDKKDNREKVQALINSIEEGKMFVSMECLLRNFDYAVENAEGKQYVVARNDETSFLTKHLRCYGGTGEYQGNKVGRLVKDITFCGKGYVENPANPQSIILSNADSFFAFSKANKINDFLESTGVSINCNHNSMENKMDEKELENLKARVAELTAAVAAKEAELQSTKVEHTAALEAANKAVVDAVAAKEDAEKKSSEVAAELAGIKAASTKADRLAKLVEAGVAKEEAEATVVKFVAFTDEQFADIVELTKKCASKVTPVTPVTEPVADDVDVNDKNSQASLENVEPTKVLTPAVPLDTTTGPSLQDSVAKLLASRLKNLNK